jgi:hypothetical protein
MWAGGTAWPGRTPDAGVAAATLARLRAAVAAAPPPPPPPPLLRVFFFFCYCFPGGAAPDVKDAVEEFIQSFVDSGGTRASGGGRKGGILLVCVVT